MLYATADADFNADFYFATATVLPILLIFILLQLGLFRAAVDEALASWQELEREKPKGWRFLWMVTVRRTTFYWMMCVLTFLGILGVILSLRALDRREIDTFSHSIVVLAAGL